MVPNLFLLGLNTTGTMASQRIERDAFLEASKDVMVLGTIKRQDDSEGQFKDILEQIWNNTMTKYSFEFLEKFHLQQSHWLMHNIQQLEKDAMFLFAKK